MAMQQLTLPGEIVKKHNELVRSKINISNKTASRILACLIASIHNDDTQFKETYVVPLKAYLPDDTGKSYQLAKEACRELAKAIVEKEEPDPDNPNGHPIWSGATFFTSIKYQKGMVKAEFNPKLSELLLQLRQCFTQYNLMEYLTLPSLYSQRLFEILKSWSNAPEVVLSVADLHRLLDTPASFRADFRAFRLRVLEKAHKDILEKTRLRYEWEAVKKGRSVETIRFTFAAKRVAIVDAKAKKDSEQKTSAANSKAFLAAADCAKRKDGICTSQDNSKRICKVCTDFNFCADVAKRRKAETRS